MVHNDSNAIFGLLCRRPYLQCGLVVDRQVLSARLSVRGRSHHRQTMFDEHLMTLLPLSVYLATKLWFYVTWFAYFADTMPFMTTVLFLASSSLLWYNFWKSWRGDPGIIRPTQEQRLRVCHSQSPFYVALRDID